MKPKKGKKSKKKKNSGNENIKIIRHNRLGNNNNYGKEIVKK